MNQQRCELSELYTNQCFHCVTGARDLGPQPTVYLEVHDVDFHDTLTN